MLLKILNMINIKEVLLLRFINVFIKKPLVVVSLPLQTNKYFINQSLENFKKEEFIFHLKDNISGADLADMQLISIFNKGIRFLLCIIDIYSKYAWVAPLKDKKGVTIVNAFQKILNDLKKIPNKIWVDKESKFYDNSFKKWLKDNDIKKYSIDNERNLLLLKDLLEL